MYKTVRPSLDCGKDELEVLKFWKDYDIKTKVLNMNKGNMVWSFYEGPPTANGKPHTGHVLTRVLKDVFTRYRAMKGFFVPRKGGWDTHGLPVELAVEKEIGITGKSQIEDFGVDKFVEECKKNVWKYVDIWKEFSTRVGYFVNMDDDCYVTYYNDYIESVWWAVKTIYDKGLIYKGFKVLPSCPSCGTALSAHEVAQGYEDRKDLTAVAKFKKVGSDNTYFLAWTTTPWTLPSNVALCVNPNVDYALVSANDEQYILAKDLIPSFFKPEEYSILEIKKGSELVGQTYEPLFDYISKADREKAFRIVSDGYVTTEEGTGIVHIAPAYGQDDARVGKIYDLPFVQMASSNGKFVDKCKDYAGLDVFKSNEQIVIDLKKQNKIFKTMKITHSYPHCWRCHSPLMYYARSGWFMKTSELRHEMVENNAKILWRPEHIKDGRMGNWLANNIDWCLSRDRYWGTPIPIWTCECGHIEVVGSVEQLKKLGNLTKDIELHKPYIDKVTFVCPDCGKAMKRVPEVLDVWFDSGCMPFAQHHYPFENKEKFKETFPAKFISEGIDQTRGWFYVMQAISTAIFDTTPYEACIANGFVVDGLGRKLSKSLGNYTPPMEMIAKMGADPVRWSLYTVNQPWNNIMFTDETVSDAIKNYLGTLYNCYSFYVLYAEIDKFDPTKYNLKDCKLTVMDRWILSKLNNLIKYVDKELEVFMSTDAAREMQKFVDKLSNWYIRCSRKRFWGEGMSQDKISAYMTLWTVLKEYAKLSAPFTPFFSETIYQNIVRSVDINAEISVHLTNFPIADESLICEELERDMDLTYSYTELGRSCRNMANIKNRQPLAKIYLTDTTDKTNLSDEYKNILKLELNVKEVVENQDISKFVMYTLKPQLKTLGPKYGKHIMDIKEYLSNCDAKKVVDTVNSGKTYSFDINGTKFDITKDDLLISMIQLDGYVSSVDGNLGVILDTTLTQNLVEEGIVREFVSKIQSLRKSLNFNVIDRIKIYIEQNSIGNILMKYKSNILSDVLATSIEFKNDLYNEFDFDGNTLKVEIVK